VSILFPSIVGVFGYWEKETQVAPLKKNENRPSKKRWHFLLRCWGWPVGLNSGNNGENNHHDFVQGPFLIFHYPFCKVFGQEVKDPNVFNCLIRHIRS